MSCYPELDNLTLSDLKKCFQKNCPAGEEYGAR